VALCTPAISGEWLKTAESSYSDTLEEVQRQVSYGISMEPSGKRSCTLPRKALVRRPRSSLRNAAA
jgi:hypothetical protein